MTPTPHTPSRPADGRRHVVLVDPALSGFEFGAQRDFEDTIVRVTGATALAAPDRGLPALVRRYTRVATRYEPLGALVPRRAFPIRADVLWVILMGPENFPLWFHRDWDRQAGRTVLYLYDTLEHQFGLIRKLLSRGRWDLCVTSFPAAVPVLERETGRRWHSAVQAVRPDRFFPLPEGEPVIGFSAYGRRVPAVHDAVRAFAERTGCYYEYSTALRPHPSLDPREYYGHYAWHVRQSWFTFSWPVEVTHPRRAPTFSPITCRWFEAAAAGAVIVGEAPKDPVFEQYFGRDFVVPFDPAAPPARMAARLEEIWADRAALRRKALQAHAERAGSWTWESRVRQILKLLDAPG